MEKNPKIQGMHANSRYWSRWDLLRDFWITELICWCFHEISTFWHCQKMGVHVGVSFEYSSQSGLPRVDTTRPKAGRKKLAHWDWKFSPNNHFLAIILYQCQKVLQHQRESDIEYMLWALTKIRVESKELKASWKTKKMNGSWRSRTLLTAARGTKQKSWWPLGQKAACFLSLPLLNYSIFEKIKILILLPRMTPRPSPALVLCMEADLVPIWTITLNLDYFAD